MSINRLLAAALAGIVLGGSGWSGPAGAEPQLTETEARQLIEQYRTMRANFETQQKQLNSLREELIGLLRANQVLREELIRRGVDVEQLLAPPPATQPQMELPLFVFESPEALADYVRENFSQRIRPEMTQLQRQLAEAQFSSWLNSAAIVPTQVSWVLKVTDAWRATKPEDVRLDYASDREPTVPALARLARSLNELEMLELNVARLRAEQRARREICERRTRELVEAPPSHKELAERTLRQANTALVEINVRLRHAEARYKAQKALAKTPRPSTQPDEAGYRVMVQGRGGRDGTIELTVFCHERDAPRLMAASKGSLVKVRGWLSDLALAERVATIGLRLDHAEVLAVNVETLPPPPAAPAGVKVQANTNSAER